MLRTSLVLVTVAIFLHPGPFSYACTYNIGLQQTEISTPITIPQLKMLVGTPAQHKRNLIAKDKALAEEINRRGVNFEVTNSIIAEVKRLGAGPLVLKALEMLREVSNDSEESLRPVTRILVADFEGPALEGSSAAALILDELNDAARGYPEIKISALDDTITSKQGRPWAAKRARELNASIIIWGWYTKTDREVLLNIHFQLVDLPALILQSEKQSIILPISEIFKFQIRLSKEMGYLTFFTVGVARLLAGDLAAARTLLTQAIQWNAGGQMLKQGDAYVTRAAVNLMDASRTTLMIPAEFYKDLESAIQLDENDGRAYSLRCAGYTLDEKLDLALEDCKKAVRLAPDNPLAYATLSWIQREHKDVKGSVDSLEKAIRIAEGMGSDNLALFYRANLHVQKEEYDDAIRHLTELLGHMISPDEEYYCLLLRAHAYQLTKSYDLAITDLSKALRIQPNSALVYWALGDISYDQNDYENAVINYSKAITLGSKSPDLYADLGDAYDLQDRPLLALESYSKAIDLDRKFVRGYLNRGITYVLTNKSDEAIRDLTQVILLEPKNGKAFRYRGRAQLGKEEFDLAIQDFRTSLELEPNHPSTHYYLGLTFEIKGDWNKALKDYDLSISLNPKGAEAYYSRGLVHAHNKTYDLALKDFNKAIEHKPDHFRAYFRRAILLSERSRIAEAISDLTKIISEAPDASLRKQAQDLLSSLTKR